MMRRFVDIRCVDIRHSVAAPKVGDREKRQTAGTAPETSERRRKKGGSAMASADDSNCKIVIDPLIHIFSLYSLYLYDKF